MVIKFLNTVFGISDESEIWWKKILPSHLDLFFNIKSFNFGEFKGDWREEVFAANGKKGKLVLFRKIGFFFLFCFVFFFFFFCFVFFGGGWNFLFSFLVG